jgi:hypothetical protein
MSKTFIIVAALILTLHGLIHLIGPTVYMKLGKVEGIAYKTTLLGGRWEVGERGIWMFGALWVVPAVGFILAAVAMLAGWSWWPPVLIGVTLFSLLLTVLDWRVAYAGVVVNLVILGVLTLEPRLVSWFAG